MIGFMTAIRMKRHFFLGIQSRSEPSALRSYDLERLLEFLPRLLLRLLLRSRERLRLLDRLSLLPRDLDRDLERDLDLLRGLYLLLLSLEGSSCGLPYLAIWHLTSLPSRSAPSIESIASSASLLE